MSRPLSAALPSMAIGLALLASLGGCADHGQQNAEYINQAKEKMTILKSGVDWEMAQQQYLAGDLKKALATIDHSILINPRVAKSHILRGRILIEQGDLESARESFLTAEGIDPTNVDAQYYQGIIHERYSEFSEALTRYTRAMDLDRANPQYPIAAAEMLMQLGKLDDAEKLLTERRADFTHNGAVCQALGQLALLRGDNDAALTHLADARMLAPDDTCILEDLVRAEVASKHYADAIEHIATLMKADKNDSRLDLVYLEARCYLGLGRYAEARADLVRITSAGSGANDLSAWTMLGEVAAKLNDLPRVRIVATTLISLAPQKPEGYLLRAVYLRKSGDPASALAILDTLAKKSAPAGLSADGHVLRALVLIDLGRTAEANTALRAALAADPTNVYARDLMTSKATAVVPETH